MLKNKTIFHIKGLNQEKLFNEIGKIAHVTQVDRKTKNETTFACSFFERKKVQKILLNKNIQIISTKNEGFLPKIQKIFTSYGVILAFFLFFIFYFAQSNFIWQYKITGNETLTQTEIIDYLKQNFSHNKSNLNTKSVEVELLEHFDQLSFVSCIVKGQTLVLNVKEKLLPEEMFGEFQPIVSNKYAKIKEIELISGTLTVKVGDIVKKGDVLVEPYTIDTSGQMRSVEPKAKIIAEVYNEGDSEHYAQKIEIERTGRVAEKNIITLFGLEIYTYQDDTIFEMYETEQETISLVKNLPLPLKMEKIQMYEVEKKIVQSDFEQVKEQYVEKARLKALNNCENYDTIIEEYYAIRHISGVTIVHYCVVTEEEIGVRYNEN